MTFAEAARAPLGKLLVTSGRDSRKEFWSFALSLLIVVIAIALTVRLMAPDLLIVTALLLVPTEYLALWAVGVRRLHDANMSGFMLLVVFVPLVGLITVAILLAKAGDPHANAYGPAPGSDATAA